MADLGRVLLATCWGLAFSASPSHASPAPTGGKSFTQNCARIGQLMQTHWPDPSTRIVSSLVQPAGPYLAPPPPGGPPPQAPVMLPEHCELYGILHERVGVNGQHYAIRFHLRLPSAWNGRFFFQGGGGSDGIVGDALGPTGADAAPALVQGFAVVSQDAGHDNAINSDPTRGGAVAFGLDPQARADYGYASLKPVADAAKSIITVYYGHKSQHSYFVGCSKGGQEGMEFAQRYPDEFDGIVANAPGFSLPRAAVSEAWDTQSMAAVNRVPGSAASIVQLANSFSDSDLALVRDAVLSACDADDGLEDGIVGAFAHCTTQKVHAALLSKTCRGDKGAACLSERQIEGLERVYAGLRDSSGKALYTDWQWDAGISGFGWRLWKIGSADGRVPSLNVALGGTSLAQVFTTPPTEVNADLQAALNFQLAFDVDRDARKIYATSAEFPRSAWEDIAARSPDLHRFAAHGGKLIVSHGVSDPVFSINDTLAWFREVDNRSQGHADRFVRVFPVPGMNHCSGGPATDHYNAFEALMAWVEQGKAPDQILARAGAEAPWPGRSRPLCPYPRTAFYKGAGDVEKATNFACRIIPPPRALR